MPPIYLNNQLNYKRKPEFFNPARKPFVLADPYAANVVLYLKGDGDNGSTTIVDETGKTINNVDGIPLSTTQSKYGVSSIYFDGVNDGLSVPASTDLNFGTSDLTIEAWCYCPSNLLGNIFSQRNEATNGITFRVYNNNLNSFYGNGSGNTTSDTNYPANTWFHAALSKNGNTARLFINGTLVGSNTWSITFGDADISYLGTNSDKFDGYMDSLRITKGVARYTANFNPETDTYLAY